MCWLPSSRGALHAQPSTRPDRENPITRRRRLPPRTDLFDERKRPTWLVAHDNWNRIHEIRELPPGSDLMRAFIVELLRYHDAGWRLSEFNAFGGYFFAEKAYEDRRMVRIATEDPRTQVTRAGNR